MEEYLRTGQPVASRTIAADPELDCGPSTVRNELALLEEYGLLAHPHVSAGRVPTDAAHRYVVDRLLSSGQVALTPRRADRAVADQTGDRRGHQATTETLSQMTNLLAIVSAPSTNAATIRHVEVLALQPQLVLVVIITSTGGVSKMLATFDRAGRSGAAAWAGEYLNERLVGLGLGARMLQQRLLDPSLSAGELRFLERFSPALVELASEVRTLSTWRAPPACSRPAELQDARQVNELIGPARAPGRAAAGAAHRPHRARRVRAHRPGERAARRCTRWRSLPAGYGLAQRKLGTVSVIGPVRMDYAGAIATVREAAAELSRFLEDTYGAS